MIKSDFWDDGEKEARLRQRVEAHLSARTIGIALGCSRNAVISKVKRLGMQLTGHVKDGQTNANMPGAAEPRRGPDLKKEGQSLRNSVRKELEWTRETIPTPFDVLPEVTHEEPMDDLPAPSWDEIPDVLLGVAFADLNSTHCRAIGANGRYCGAPIAHEKFSYRTEHAKRYLTTPARLKAQQNEETAAEGRSKLGRWA